MHHGSRPTWIETDQAAIGHNLGLLRTLVGPDCELMAVLKADGYGHGAVPAALAALAGGAQRLALATLDEALALRRAGVEAPLLLLGYAPPWQLRAAVAANVAVTVGDREAALALGAAAAELCRPALAHVKVDTGMARLGAEPQHALALLRLLATLPGVRTEGIYTHLATADGEWASQPPPDPSFPNPGLAHAHAQLDRFDQLLEELACAGLRPPLAHAANSAALLMLPRARRYELARPGLAIYGLAPCPPGDDAGRAVCMGLRPALSWRTSVVRVADVAPGAPVSYGAAYIASGHRRIATIPVGYADGLRRSPPWREVLVRGRRAPIVGRICMDYAMCDVTDVGGAAPGDPVTLLGTHGDDGISAAEAADWLGTSVYELLTAIGTRVTRVAR